MSLSPGVRLGAYEIVALAGAGGMGEVYRAHDTKLGRSVAVSASITNDVFIDSQKQPLKNGSQPQPWRTELRSKQLNPVTITLQGESAAAVWNGVRLMEVTVDAVYDGSAKLHCNFAFMGRFYPQIKEIGTVSSVISPSECRRR